MSMYRITDLDGMCEAMRDDIFANPEVGIPHDSIGMDGYVTVGQIRAYVRSLAREVDGALYVDGSFYDEVNAYIIETITNAALARLASSGWIESVIGVSGEFDFVRPPRVECSMCDREADPDLDVCPYCHERCCNAEK